MWHYAVDHPEAFNLWTITEILILQNRPLNRQAFKVQNAPTTRGRGVVLKDLPGLSINDISTVFSSSTIPLMKPLIVKPLPIASFNSFNGSNDISHTLCGLLPG
jgi:hypothetical protein